MRKSSLFVIILFLCTSITAQSVQYGYVEEYNGAKAKTPLSNVNVNAGGATARSGKDGKFKLEFLNLNVGDRVHADINNVAVLKGYVLFNKEAVEQWCVSGKQVYFRIVLCKKEVFDNLVMTYYNVSDKSLKNQLKKERDRVERMKHEGQIQQLEYEGLLREADERYQNALKHLRENAEMVARIDESELDEEQAEILRLAKEGMIEEAVEMIKKSNTVELFDRAVKKNEYAARQRAFYEDKVEESLREWNILLERMNEEEHFMRESIARDSTDYTTKAYLSLALLLQGQYAASEQMALEIKDVVIDGKPVKESMIQFLERLDEKGIVPSERKSDVSRFLELLQTL